MLTIDEEIEFLGLQAAMCDVWACYPATPPAEARNLARRAARYRELQLDALTRNESIKQQCIYTPAELNHMREWCKQLKERTSK